MKNSLVSVIIPLFNAEKYILYALESVEQQTVNPFEIVVVNDGSTDNSKKVVLEFIKKSKLNIKYFDKENGGSNSARNLGVNNSSGDYLAFLDSDDSWYPTKLEKQLVKFERKSFQNLGCVYTAYDFIDDNNEINKQIRLMKPKVKGNIYDKLLYSNQVMGSASSVMIKRECFDKVGYFDESLKIGEDWDMWLRISKEYYFDFVDEKLVSIRRHSSNIQNNIEQVFIGELDFYQKWIPLVNKFSVKSFWFLKSCMEIVRYLPKKDLLKIYSTRKTDFPIKNVFFLKLIIFLLIIYDHTMNFFRDIKIIITYRNE